MEYGILIAELGSYEGNGVDAYQVIGAVSSIDEAKEMVRNYLQWADPDSDLCPDRFVIQRRNNVGSYRVREIIDLENVGK